MLKELRISNLILIPYAEVHFEKGFNVLSGETGSGKSAIMQALSLLMGEKADVNIIRHGTEKAAVEGLFDIDNLSIIEEILDGGGIGHEKGEILILRREISKLGKGRCWINNQAAQLSLLRKIGETLIDLIGQHANQRLLSIDNHRRILDLLGGLEEDCERFAKNWDRELTLSKLIQDTIQNEAYRLREIENCNRELEELREANLKEGEEENLFSEYTHLANAEDIVSKIHDITQLLCGDKLSVLNLLTKQISNFDHLLRLTPTLQDTAIAYRNACLELQEVAHTLRIAHAHHEPQPDKLAAISERLALVHQLKRKYGESISDILSYQQKTQEKVHHLEAADTQIDDWRNQLFDVRKQNDELALVITNKRRAAAQALIHSLTIQLRSLNMGKVEFQIEITSQNRSRTGDNRIEFFLVPNVGEKRIPIKECASGGELSRILLALQTILAGKEDIPTLIFDEIDANIGGATAVAVGEKLREIGSNHQVICITHFPQVAKQANHHIQIEKQEIDGRTVTSIKTLDREGRQLELCRMLGNS
jgi:DNA repair protein RecN (Recombination protein N)